jgi:hypothetical protein
MGEFKMKKLILTAALCTVTVVGFSVYCGQAQALICKGGQGSRVCIEGP